MDRIQRRLDELADVAEEIAEETIRLLETGRIEFFWCGIRAKSEFGNSYQKGSDLQSILGEEAPDFATCRYVNILPFDAHAGNTPSRGAIRCGCRISSSLTSS